MEKNYAEWKKEKIAQGKTTQAKKAQKKG